MDGWIVMWKTKSELFLYSLLYTCLHLSSSLSVTQCYLLIPRCYCLDFGVAFQWSLLCRLYVINASSIHCHAYDWFHIAFLRFVSWLPWIACCSWESFATSEEHPWPFQFSSWSHHHICASEVVELGYLHQFFHCCKLSKYWLFF